MQTIFKICWATGRLLVGDAFNLSSDRAIAKLNLLVTFFSECNDGLFQFYDRNKISYGMLE